MERLSWAPSRVAASLPQAVQWMELQNQSHHSPRRSRLHHTIPPGRASTNSAVRSRSPRGFAPLRAAEEGAAEWPYVRLFTGVSLRCLLPPFRRSPLAPEERWRMNPRTSPSTPHPRTEIRREGLYGPLLHKSRAENGRATSNCGELVPNSFPAPGYTTYHSLLDDPFATVDEKPYGVRRRGQSMPG